MKIYHWIALSISHIAIAFAGFALGIYMLPILIAPEAPVEQMLNKVTTSAIFRGELKRDLKGSDSFHWGEGKLSISDKYIALDGQLAPGPDYKLYLSPAFVETETEFLDLKEKMVRVAEIKTFKNFLVPYPEELDLEQFTTVVIWCETFSEFISATRYR